MPVARAAKKAKAAPPPPKPSAPSQRDIDTGVAMDVETFMRQLVTWVNHEMWVYLKAKGLMLETSEPDDLATLPPLPYDRTSNSGMKSFRAAFDFDDALTSLRSTELYEASVNAWWIDPFLDTWQGEQIGDIAITWGDFQTAKLLWSLERFLASSDTPQFRRFIFPGCLSSAVPAIVEIERAKVHGCLQKLPVFGGKCVLWSWYGALAEALEGMERGIEEPDLVGKLAEAGLTMLLRIRAPCSAPRATMDMLSYSESLRIEKSVASDSFFFFAVLLSKLPCFADAKSPTIKAFKKAADDAGITFNGNKLSLTCCTAVKSILPFAAKPAVRTAFKSLDRFSYILDDQAKLMRLCHLLQKEPDAEVALIFIMQTLKLGLLCGDIDGKETTVAFLLGTTAFFMMKWDRTCKCSSK